MNNTFKPILVAVLSVVATSMFYHYKDSGPATLIRSILPSAGLSEKIDLDNKYFESISDCVKEAELFKTTYSPRPVVAYCVAMH